MKASDRPTIDALPLDLWEGATAEVLAADWRVPRVVLLAEVGSTNDYAKAAAAGAPTGTVVLAEQQLAGRGRSGRRWASPPGLGLYLSFISRPDAAALPTYPLRVALAVARSLDPLAGREVRIKWPNDLLLGDRKFAGILCEATWTGSSVSSAIVGIGINVLHTTEDFPPELRDTAGSIRLAAADVSRRAVAAAVVRGVANLLSRESTTNGLLDSDEVRELNSRHAFTGRHVDVFEPDSGRTLVTGRVDEIAADGALRVRDGDAVHAIRSGTLRPSRDP